VGFCFVFFFFWGFLAMGAVKGQLRESRHASVDMTGWLLLKKRPQHCPKSKSMSFVQHQTGASQWSIEWKRSNDDQAAAQWTAAGGRCTHAGEIVIKPAACFKAAAPMWKQLMKKLCAQAKRWHMQLQSVRAGPEWTNYDAQSYAKNFDNGGWADSYFDEEDEDEDKLGLRETALHTALLQKLYSKRGYKTSSTAASDSAAAAPVLRRAASVPVIPIRPYRGNKDFVPIWERRQTQPPSKLKLAK
jgi:hypothetical protein